MMRSVLVVGGGMGGLAAAADLARQGVAVTLLERAAAPGGKARKVAVGGAAVDGGPTVFTMRWIFEALFADAGRSFADHVAIHPADLLARHAWRAGGRLDLFADIEASVDAIAAFAGPAEAAGYRAFVARSADIYRTLERPFIASQQPSPLGLAGRAPLAALWRTAPFRTMWGALGEHFRDPRLRQLFGRYATYTGCSPFAAPATLMLIAHVEQEGVWLVEGGMARVAAAIAELATAQGARLRMGAHVAEILVRQGRAHGVRLAGGEELTADALLFNGDVSALGQGLLGEAARIAAPATPPAARSLSAFTWCAHAPTSGFPLAHHNVFFAEDYAAEFDAIFRRRAVTEAPTVYVCAQDRGLGQVAPGAPERLLLLVNAPADGDRAEPPPGPVQQAMVALLGRCGLTVEGLETAIRTGPQGFHALFPGSGGALYGRAGHGMRGSFARPGSQSRLPGLYLAGGSVHPGAGVPMAVMSGRLAAAALLAEPSP
jgi:1-hydroxycarotenoid 3,4-desaturase